MREARKRATRGGGVKEVKTLGALQQELKVRATRLAWLPFVVHGSDARAPVHDFFQEACHFCMLPLRCRLCFVFLFASKRSSVSFPRDAGRRIGLPPDAIHSAVLQ